MDFQALKVLIVEDSENMALILKKMLQDIGLSSIAIAMSGEEALRLIENSLEEKKGFDFVFSDYLMPDMSGLDLLKSIRSKENSQNLKFIVVTADKSKDSILEFIQAGVTDFIMKPVRKEKMKEKMNRILKNENS